jgi:fibronectin type 3 domain-containing protein
LSWSKPNKKVKGYWVYRAAYDGEYEKINTVLLKKNFFKDTKVVNGQLYWYAVSYVDKNGNESLLSDVVSITPNIHKTPLSGY